MPEFVLFIRSGGDIISNFSDVKKHLMYLQKSFFAFIFCIVACQLSAQNEAAKVVVPDWALPGSATHKQVPPPADFHRATITENVPIGIFQGQSDVGAALVA